MAFMQHREAAFEQLIALMDAMLNSNESDFNAALTGIALTGHETGSSNDAEPEGGWSTATSPSCSEGACGTKKQKEKGGIQTIQPLSDIVAVNVEVLDHEHSECALALTNLANTLTVETLKQVFHIYLKHFTHEEELLDQHLYHDILCNDSSSKQNGFSADGNARDSHFSDHARLLNDLKQEIVRLERVKESTTSKEFVNKVLRDFESHANQYDDAYADRLSQAIN